MNPTRDTERQTESERIQKDTAEFLKAGGKILTAGNDQTEYARSGMHAYNNQARRDAARANLGK